MKISKTKAKKEARWLLDISLIGTVVLTLFILIVALSSCSSTTYLPATDHDHDHDYLLDKRDEELMHCRICGKQERVPSYYINYHNN